VTALGRAAGECKVRFGVPPRHGWREEKLAGTARKGAAGGADVLRGLSVPGAATQSCFWPRDLLEIHGVKRGRNEHVKHH